MSFHIPDDVCRECGHFWKDHAEAARGCCAASFDDGEMAVCYCNKWLDDNDCEISGGPSVLPSGEGR